MDNITYDTKNDSVTVQPPAPPVPDPIVLTRADIEAKVTEYQGIIDANVSNGANLQDEIEALGESTDDATKNRDEYQAMLDGLDDAKGAAAQAVQDGVG